jgi:hypothetical protein
MYSFGNLFMKNFTNFKKFIVGGSFEDAIYISSCNLSVMQL